MKFLTFKEAVNHQFSLMAEDELWDTYLESFPEGTNPIFRERT